MKHISRAFYTIITFGLLLLLSPSIDAKASNTRILVTDARIDYVVKANQKNPVDWTANGGEVYCYLKVTKSAEYRIQTHYSLRYFPEFEIYKKNGNFYEIVSHTTGSAEVNRQYSLSKEEHFDAGDEILIYVKHNDDLDDEKYISIVESNPVVKVDSVVTRTMCKGMPGYSGICITGKYKDGSDCNIDLSYNSFSSNDGVYTFDAYGNYFYVGCETPEKGEALSEGVPGIYQFYVRIVHEDKSIVDFDSKKENKSYKVEIKNVTDYLKNVKTYKGWEKIPSVPSPFSSELLLFDANVAGEYLFRFNGSIKKLQKVNCGIFEYDQQNGTCEKKTVLRTYNIRKTAMTDLEQKKYLLLIAAPQNIDVQLGLAKAYIPITSISGKNKITLYRGEWLNYAKTIKFGPANASNSYISYSSKNSKIATVSDKGHITAVGYGTTEIVAKMDDVYTTCKVTVLPAENDKFTTKNISYQITKANPSAAEVTVTAIDKKQTAITIPETVRYQGITYRVTAIAPNMAKGNTKLKSLVIGSNIKSIGDMAFYKCKKLNKVVINTDVLTKKTFGKKSFTGIYKKAKIYVPKKKLKAYKKLLKNNIPKNATVKKS